MTHLNSTVEELITFKPADAIVSIPGAVTAAAMQTVFAVRAYLPNANYFSLSSDAYLRSVWVLRWRWLAPPVGPLPVRACIMN